MQTYKQIWIILLFLISGISTWAQCPLPSFSVPDTICVNETLSITNNTTGATRYEWDFCSGDLEGQPVFQSISTITSAVIPTDITTVFDGTNWFGFVADRDNNRLLRLDFGNSINNIPSINDLGNFGGLLAGARPNGIKFRKEGLNWYALFVNVTGTASNNLLRLNFGSSLSNAPVVTNITNVSAILYQPRGIDLAEDGGRLIVVIANYGGKKVTIVNFGNSIVNLPASSDILNTGTFSDELAKVSLIKYCNNWHAFIIGTNFYRLDFGSNLFSIPSISNISSTIPSIEGISNLKFIIEKDIIALAVTRLGKVYKINFGNTVINVAPIVTNIPTNGIVNDLESLEVLKEDASYIGLLVDWRTNNLVKIHFNTTCTANIPNLSSITPVGIHYTTGGMKKITLIAYTNDNHLKAITDSIFVRPEIPADFLTSLQCIGSNTSFNAIAAPAGNRITSWAWDFGDGNTAIGKSAVYSYAASGTYPVTLTTIDVCNQVNTVAKQVVIYEKNTANFTAPTTNCSNESITFQDASSAIDDEVKFWRWDFGDGQTSSQQNPQHTFIQAGNFNVVLTITGKSGCTETVTKPITIVEGASVNFNVENACIDNTTAFKDQTIFASNTYELSRLWDFGDGNTSVEQSPTHKYNSPGNYTVVLTIKNNLNCTTIKSKVVTIRKLPDAAYSFSLACSGEPIVFSDESTSIEGSVAAWLWNFNDPDSETNNTSTARNPSHLFKKAGSYQVKLQVQTIYGCMNSVIQTVIVIESPQANFSYQLNCDSKQVDFSDESVSNTITNRYWDFGDGNTSSAEDPQHIYNQVGSYTVALTTTDASRCIHTISKVIKIYDLPIADFEFSGKNCLNELIQFTDKSSISNDSIISWKWDFGAFGESVEQHPKISFDSSTSVTVDIKLTVTSASGCSATVTKNISLYTSPQVQFTYEALSALSPLQMNFNSTASVDATNYKWDFGDDKESILQNPIHTYENGGAYTVSLTVSNANGCTIVLSKEIIVSTVPDIYELKLEALLANYVGNDMQLQANVLNNGTQVLRELNFITVIDDKYTFTHTWTGNLQPGQMIKYNYSVSGANLENRLPSLICVIAIDKVHNQNSNRQCINPVNNFTVLNPYPNPADEYVLFPVFSPVSHLIEITITDILGRTINTFITDMPSGFYEEKIDVSKLAAGVYYIHFNYQGKVFLKKIIII